VSDEIKPMTSKQKKISQDLINLVSSEVYETWLSMLRELVPWGRTHRLGVLVAGMIQYACSCVNGNHTENVVVDIFEESAGIGMDYEEQAELFSPIIEQLFLDAGVGWKRVNYHGKRYSVVDQSIHEYLHWDAMPWE